MILPQSTRTNCRRLFVARKNWPASIQYGTEAVAGGVLLKSCSQKFHKIYRKTPVPDSHFK